MENKHVGWIIVGIAVIMVMIIIIFNMGLKNIVDSTCAHGSECTMYDTISIQTGISMALAGIILVIGVVIMNTKPKERIIVKKIKPKKKRLNLEGLNAIEKSAIKMLQEENGAIFQKTMMEKLEIGKVGMTRLLDKLESRELIERKRRGMNNVVVLKR